MWRAEGKGRHDTSARQSLINGLKTDCELFCDGLSNRVLRNLHQNVDSIKVQGTRVNQNIMKIHKVSF